MIIEGATKIYFISNENPGNKCPPWPMLTNLSALQGENTEFGAFFGQTELRDVTSWMDRQM